MRRLGGETNACAQGASQVAVITERARESHPRALGLPASLNKHINTEVRTKGSRESKKSHISPGRRDLPGMQSLRTGGQGQKFSSLPQILFLYLSCSLLRLIKRADATTKPPRSHSCCRIHHRTFAHYKQTHILVSEQTVQGPKCVLVFDYPRR